MEKIKTAEEVSNEDLKNHFYLPASVGIAHVNMDPNANKETFDAVKKMAELAYHKVKT